MTDEQLFYTRVKNIDELVKVAIFSNPESRVHVLYKKDNIVYIFYSNARELVWSIDDIEPGLYEWRDRQLHKLPEDFKFYEAVQVFQIFVYITEVLESNLLADL